MAEKAGQKTITIRLGENTLLYVLIFAVVGLVAFNQYMIFKISSTPAGAATGVTGSATTGSSAQTSTGEQTDYGLTLDSTGYEQLLNYYQTISLDSLTEEQKARVIAIGTQPRTACEACCGIGQGPQIRENGQTACGCGHNLALIGLVRFLVRDYGDQYTDQQILDEIWKWKVVFFPQLADTGTAGQSTGQSIGGC